MKPDESDLIDAGIIYPSDNKAQRLLLRLAARIGFEAGNIWRALQDLVRGPC